MLEGGFFQPSMLTITQYKIRNAWRVIPNDTICFLKTQSKPKLGSQFTITSTDESWKQPFRAAWSGVNNSGYDKEASFQLLIWVDCEERSPCERETNSNGWLPWRAGCGPAQGHPSSGCGALQQPLIKYWIFLPWYVGTHPHPKSFLSKPLASS